MLLCGFGSKWRRWIKTCLSQSSRISIPVNGAPEGFFSGVRQGDPICSLKVSRQTLQKVPRVLRTRMWSSRNMEMTLSYFLRNLLNKPPFPRASSSKRVNFSKTKATINCNYHYYLINVFDSLAFGYLSVSSATIVKGERDKQHKDKCQTLTVEDLTKALAEVMFIVGVAAVHLQNLFILWLFLQCTIPSSIDVFSRTTCVSCLTESDWCGLGVSILVVRFDDIGLQLHKALQSNAGDNCQGERDKQQKDKRQVLTMGDLTKALAEIDSIIMYSSFATARDIERIVKETEVYSGSDLQALCEEAAMMPIRELGQNIVTVKANQVRPLRYADFKVAMTVTRPSLQRSKWDELEKWNQEFGSS